MDTAPTVGSIVQVRATGARGTVTRNDWAGASGVSRPVVFVSWRLHEVCEAWEQTLHELEALDLILAAPYIQPDVCLYCWAEVPAERKPEPRWAGAKPRWAGAEPSRTRRSRYCSDDHQKADARWDTANRAGLRKAVDGTPNGKGLAPSARKPGPGRQVITPPAEGSNFSMDLQVWT